jgi:hypothetical protein
MARRRRGDGFARWPFVVLAIALTLSAAAWFAASFVEARLNRAEAPRPGPVRVTVGGVALTVPRDLVRFEHQKRDAELARLDLLFRWPGLEGAGGDAALPPDALARLVFLTITPKDEALDPLRRLAAVYNRFLEPAVAPEGQGLAARRFRPDSGYDGEELVYDPVRPGSFFVRCAPPTGDAPASCMREQRRGERIDIVVRFPRTLLTDWRRLDQAIEALLAGIGAPRS